MDKIGILTFHSSNNFGSVLLAYAMQHIVESLGYGAEIIDFTTEKTKKAYAIFADMKKYGLHGLPYNTYALLNYRKLKAKQNKYDEFRKSCLKLTEKSYAVNDELQNEKFGYKAVICGSDQIWNFDAYVYDDAYFLGFVPKGTKRIAYAPSLGVTKEFDKRLKDYKQELEAFDFLSVREVSGKDKLNKIVDKSVYIVPDPVFLLDRSEWDRLAGDEPLIKDKYILIYSIGYNPFLYETAKALHRSCGYKMVSIMPDWRMVFFEGETAVDCGPKEFLNYIKNAEYVCSNSFHASAFSIIFNKQFLFANGKSEDERITSVLSEYGIENRFINDTQQLKELEKISYKEINTKVKANREKALELLKRGIEK